MKGVLYYFSGTGNTKFVADKFKSTFKSYNVDIKLINIEDRKKVQNECFKKNDFIIFGSPVHAEFPPKIVLDFLREIKPQNKLTKALVYCTQAGKSSSAPCFISKCLREKRFEVKIQCNIRMPNNYYFSVGKKPLKENIERLLANSEEKVKNIVECFMNNKAIIESNSLVRVHFSKIFHKIFSGKLPKLSKNITSSKECNKCGKCLMNCPESNITFEDGKPVFHSKCILCMRCIHICPINAIRYKGKNVDQTQKEIINVLNISE